MDHNEKRLLAAAGLSTVDDLFNQEHQVVPLAEALARLLEAPLAEAEAVVRAAQKIV